MSVLGMHVGRLMVVLLVLELEEELEAAAEEVVGG